MIFQKCLDPKSDGGLIPLFVDQVETPQVIFFTGGGVPPKWTPNFKHLQIIFGLSSR